MLDIRHAISIDATPEKILPLIASASGFAQWSAQDVTENSSTKTVELGFFHRATVYSLAPLPASAPGEVAWQCLSGKEWSGTKLQFQWIPGDKYTLVNFSQAGW